MDPPPAGTPTAAGRHSRHHFPLRTAGSCASPSGALASTLCYGRDPRDRRWRCPQLEAWGVGPRPEFTPAVRRRPAFAVSPSGTYAEAAEVTTECGVPVADATLHALEQNVGACAEAQNARRLETPVSERETGRAPSELAVLMIDGSQLRNRGPGWGKVNPKEPHVELHELKLDVFYREEQAGQTAGGRGLLSGKRIVSWRGEAAELRRRLHWEAQADGLARAARVRSVNDGAPSIWHLVGDRWPQAEEVLDFYHGSQYLHSLDAALHGEGAATTRA